MDLQAIRTESPRILLDFLTYTETIRGKSTKTAQEYYLDLRLFLRFIKRSRGLVPSDTPFAEISISDLDENFFRSITLSDAYDYLLYLTNDRPKHQNSPMTAYGDIASTRARKISTIRSFFNYLTEKIHILETNPMAQLDSPKRKKALPQYLSASDSMQLLSNVDGEYPERDYCILTFFLNCGMRVSELTGINMSDIQDNRLRILGKGNKERTVYLNEACLLALRAYLPKRIHPLPQFQNALFISRNRKRISPSTVKWLVKRHLMVAGLDASKYSVHKLRHTAATLMYQNGVDVRTLKDVLGHVSLDTTMIYTHLSDENMQKAADKNPLSGVAPPFRSVPRPKPADEEDEE